MERQLDDFPQAAIGFAAYLGMAVANQWDKDWAHYKDKLGRCILNCTQVTLDLLRHEEIQTPS